MEDAEAEAVLWALGEPLTWQQWGNSHRWQTGYVAPEMTDVYAIHVISEGTTVRYKPMRDGHRRDDAAPPATQVSFETAKAACERHRATGKWE